MQRRTYKRSTLFCVKKRADEIWERGENPHRRQCALLPLSLPPRRGTIPIIARALTTCGYHPVRKPPPLYITVGSPRRSQPPGTAISTRRFSKPAPTAGAPRSCANTRPTYPKVLKTSPNGRGTGELRQQPPLRTRRFSPCGLLRRRENRRFISSGCETDWRVPRRGTILHI